MATLPLLSPRVIRPMHMFLYIRRLQPRASILFKRLDPRFEFSLLQRKVVNRANSWDAHARVSTASTVQERAAYAAKGVFHVVSGCNGGILSEACELVFAAEVFKVCVFHYKVGGEHAVVVSGIVWGFMVEKYLPRGDLVAVCAMADEGIDQTLAFSRYFDLYGATVAGCCCCAISLAVGALGGKDNLFAHGAGFKMVLDGYESFHFSRCVRRLIYLNLCLLWGLIEDERDEKIIYVPISVGSENLRSGNVSSVDCRWLWQPFQIPYTSNWYYKYSMTKCSSAAIRHFKHVL